jgi:hypothetical protein
LPALMEASEEEESNNDESSTQQDESSVVESVQAPVTPAPKKRKVDRRPWYLQRGPILFTEVLPVLLRIGWKKVSSECFSHPNLPDQRFDSIQSVQLYMCSERIPNVDKEKIALTSDDYQLVNRWVNFALLEKHWDKLGTAKILKEEAAKAIMFRLGCTTAGEK